VDARTVAVSEPRSGLTARVRLDQPARQGFGGIWGITGINSTAELTLPPACLERDPAGLQASFDQGHQPWLASPITVAEVCTRAAFGWPHPLGRQLSADHVLVVDDSIGEAADVLGRRWPAVNGVWLVTSAEPEVGQD
jgi:hypothetical protein